MFAAIVILRHIINELKSSEALANCFQSAKNVPSSMQTINHSS